MMKKATLGAFLVLFILGAAAVRAEDVSKFWVVPAVGYRTNSSFSITSEEVDFTRIRFEGAFAYGISVGYRLSEFLAVEAMWSRSDTKVVGVFSGDPEFRPNSLVPQFSEGFGGLDTQTMEIQIVPVPVSGEEERGVFGGDRCAERMLPTASAPAPFG